MSAQEEHDRHKEMAKRWVARLKPQGKANGGDRAAPAPASVIITQAEVEEITLPAVSEMPEPPPHLDGSEVATKPWPLPEPLGGELTAVPAFNLEILPKSLRPLTEDVSERMQVQPEVPAVVTLVSLGATVARRAYIQPKQKDSTWKVYPNVWGVPIMPSGFLKTPTMNAILEPLREKEDQFREEHKLVMAEYQRQKERADNRLTAWKQLDRAAYKKGKPEPPRPDDPPPEPFSRRLIVNDATTAKLQEILSQNPGGVLFFRDELTGLFDELDDVGHGGDRQFYMDRWNGSRYTMDRISRGTHDADGCLSILGGMTPRALHVYMADAERKGRLDDGLLQRFQLAVQPDQPDDPKDIDRLPNYSAMAEAKATYERLLALDPARPSQFRFDPEAQQLFKAWRPELEAKIRSGTLHPALVSHLSKYRSLMPSLALLYELADNTSQTTVSLEHAKQAAEACSFFEAHARRIYAPVISAQRQVAELIRRHLAEGWKHDEGTFHVRDIYRSNWRGIRGESKEEKAVIRDALDILSDAHWIRPVAQKTNGRPSEVYAINPRLKEVRQCPVNG